MERGTGIEPATNSVEGCDSTVELPPPTFEFTTDRSALVNVIYVSQDSQMAPELQLNQIQGEN